MRKTPESVAPVIGLVSASHLCSNPRLVKEARTLQEAGYDVRVVAGRSFPANDGFDREILAGAAWKTTLVDFHDGIGSAVNLVLRRMARLGIRLGRSNSLRMALQAHHPAGLKLAAAARRLEAELLIGHTLVGLGAAGLAARGRGTRLGFDAEDFHPGESNFAREDPVERRVIEIIERTLLPRCVHLTTAAPLIGEAYVHRYGIALPQVILNVFPRVTSVPPPPTAATHRPPDVTRLYWFSQTIGPDRGLEQLITVLAQVKHPVQLTLRGHGPEPYRQRLQELAHRVGFADRLFLSPPLPADTMIPAAAEHDIGLALEHPSPPNRDICLTNKFFTYLQAGLPVFYSPTRGQVGLARELGDAAIRLDLDQPDQARTQIEAFLADPGRRQTAVAAAKELGQTRYHWDFEKQILLETVANSLRQPAR